MQVQIDLFNHSMKFPLENFEVPFLKDHEIKKNKILNPHQVTSHLTKEQQDEMIKKLTDMGATPEQARELLVQTAWNADQAASLLFEMSQLQ